MTTIIMVEDVKGITIGYDSQATGGDTIWELESHKVFSSNGIVYGVSGSALYDAEIQFMELPEYDGGDARKWIVKKFLPALRELKKEIDSENESSLSLLMVIDNKVFEIGSDLSITRNKNGVYAVGSGADFALGALVSGASVEKALETAAQLDIYTGGPLHVTTPEALKMREAPVETV